MLAYHNDPSIKAKYLARVQEHRRLDQIVQGYGYWKDGKGCAVGCSIHGNSHKSYETELGIPESIARLEDVIFEGLPREVALDWPGRFLEAIEPGVDLSRVQWRFLFWLLTEFDRSWVDHPIIGTAIKTSANLMHEMAVNGTCDVFLAEAAEAAAEAVAWDASDATDDADEAAMADTKVTRAVARATCSAASAADWAARVEAEADEADDTCNAARAYEAAADTAYAAVCAADAAVWAAGAAAGAAAYTVMADKLVETLSDCPYLGSAVAEVGYSAPHLGASIGGTAILTC